MMGLWTEEKAFAKYEHKACTIDEAVFNSHAEDKKSPHNFYPVVPDVKLVEATIKAIKGGGFRSYSKKQLGKLLFLKKSESKVWKD